MHFRPARADDVPVLAQRIYGEPTGDTVAIFGSAERAIKFGLVLMALCDDLSWPATEVAELDGEVVGLVMDGSGSADPPPRRLVPGVLRAIGPRALLALPRAVALESVRMSPPDGAWVVRELHVAPAHRGRGLGAQLIERAETRAATAGVERIALVTRTNNPARRLYERAGYRVTVERTNPRYERVTGAAGRLLMEKSLVPR